MSSQTCIIIFSLEKTEKGILKNVLSVFVHRMNIKKSVNQR